MIPEFPNDNVDKKLILEGIELFKRAINEGINKSSETISYNKLTAFTSLGLSLVKRGSRFSNKKLNPGNIDKLSNKIGVPSDFIVAIKNLRNKADHLLEDYKDPYYNDFDIFESKYYYEIFLDLIEEVEEYYE